MAQAITAEITLEEAGPFIISITMAEERKR
jgi:hypothetical protein